MYSLTLLRHGPEGQQGQAPNDEMEATKELASTQFAQMQARHVCKRWFAEAGSRLCKCGNPDKLKEMQRNTFRIPFGDHPLKSERYRED